MLYFLLPQAAGQRLSVVKTGRVASYELQTARLVVAMAMVVMVFVAKATSGAWFLALLVEKALQVAWEPLVCFENEVDRL